jgi:hypothetical protein
VHPAPPVRHRWASAGVPAASLGPASCRFGQSAGRVAILQPSAPLGMRLLRHFRFCPLRLPLPPPSCCRRLQLGRLGPQRRVGARRARSVGRRGECDPKPEGRPDRPPSFAQPRLQVGLLPPRQTAFREQNEVRWYRDRSDSKGTWHVPLEVEDPDLALVGASV